MNNSIKCPYCKKEIQISEAFRHQLQDEISEKLKKETDDEIQKIKENTIRQTEEKYLLEIKDIQLQLDERKAKVDELRENELILREKTRKLEDREKEFELESRRKLDEERKKIEEETGKKIQEDYRLKDLEKDKLISDLKQSLDSARRKAQQGSQQTQGEVMELELEEILRREFHDDKISEVKKGQRGADVIQAVFDKMGRKCGTILWESKNAQWSESWIKKLREDQREAKAELAILVAENPPEDVETFTYRDRIWIVKRKYAKSLAIALRFDLIHIFFEKASNVGKDEKMEIIYQYLTGPEFQHRIEGIVDAFSALQENIEKEKRFFGVKWAREEKEIRRIIDNTHGMWGELQAVTNRGLPQIKSLELDSGKQE